MRTALEKRQQQHQQQQQQPHGVYIVGTASPHDLAVMYRGRVN